MLVTLAQAQTVNAGASQTFQYACNSLQTVYLRSEEDTAVIATDIFITVQIGNTVICNDISLQGLGLLSAITGGGSVKDANQCFKLDFGSHVLDGEENLYVTVRNSDAANFTNVDIACTVNEGGLYQPLKYTNYADVTFTDTNTLAVFAYGTSTIDEVADVMTIRNQSYSSAPSIASGCIVSACNSWSNSQDSATDFRYIASMAKNQVPMNTSVNFASGTNVTGVICISAMDRLPSKARQARSAGQAVVSSMTPAERKAL